MNIDKETGEVLDFDKETGEQILPIKLNADGTLADPEPPFLPFVKTPLNYHRFPRAHEINTLPSLTIPDQSLTVTEILERHSRGLGYEGVRVDIYEFDEDGNEIMQIPDLNGMDLADRMQMLYDAREYVSQLQQQAQKEHEANSTPPQKNPENEAHKAEEIP